MRLIKKLSNYFKSILFYFKGDIIENKLKKLHNIHLGEECYIFGDGVSIKHFDLSLFNDKPSIVSNNFIFHKDFNKLNVKYYSMFEPYWFLPIFVTGFKGIKFLINRIQKTHIKKFKLNPNIIFFTDISNALSLKGNNVSYIEKTLIKTFMPFDAGEIDLCQGSLRVEISLAILLGFKKAYLIGHDYTHKDAYALHYYEKGNGTKVKPSIWNKDFLEIVSQHIDITTVTLNGGSPLLKSITYKKLTGNTPVFRENIEIVDKEDLQTLSSWPGYKI